MVRIAILLVLLGLTVAMPWDDAAARNRTGRGALIGGASGAIIGGAVGGGRGAAIGAAIGAGTGAVAGSRRRSRYYWHNGRCRVRFANGESRHVSNHYCR